MSFSIKLILALFFVTLLSGCGSKDNHSFNNTEDNKAPNITLIGEDNVSVVLGSEYIEDGVIATDERDGNLISSVITTGTVDTRILGTYTLNYSVTDSAGNEANVTRVIHVALPLDITPPNIILIGESNITIIKDEPYIKKGAVAFDVRDGNLTNLINTTGTVDTSILGTYTLNYSVIDSAGNEANVTRVVNVIFVPINTAIKIKKTGQTINYNTDENVVIDSNIKDDGYYQKGIKHNYTRDNTLQIVTDHISKLMWQDNYAAKSVRKSWTTIDNYDAKNYHDTSGDTAITYCSEMILGDYHDWRLPTVKELSLIIDHSVKNEAGEYNPSIYPVFKYARFNTYITGSTHIDISKEHLVWWISFGDSIHSLDEGRKKNLYWIRCVRDYE